MNYFFWFLLFLAVPIVVHLFNFRRAKKILFTNVRFVRKVSTETKSKTRLKHFLILGSRILSFIFLLLAFFLSLVIFESGELELSDSFGLIYLDNSNSSIGDDVNDEKQFIEELILSQKPNEGYLLTNDFSGFSGNERTKAEIIQQLGDLSVSSMSRPINEVLNRLQNINQTYLISDFQDIESDDLVSIKSDSTRNYILVVNEKSVLRNAYVDSVWLEKDLDNYSNMIVNCQIGHTANFIEGSVVVKFIDNDNNQISSIVVSMDSDLTISFSLPQNFNNPKFRIQISGDDVEFDNEFYLMVEKVKKPSILVLSASSNKYLLNIFGNSDLFELNVSSGDIDYELLKQVDLVVVNDFSRLPGGLVSQNIDETTFLIIPADSIDYLNYKSETGFSFDYLGEADQKEIQIVEGNTLMKDVYRKIDNTSEFPVAQSVFVIVEPHEPILKLRQGSTFLGKSNVSNLYFLTSPLRDNFTTFPNHSIFLPTLYRIADESIDRSKDLFTYPNMYFESSELLPDLPPKIVTDLIEIIPEFRIKDQGGLIRVPSNLLPGFYHVVQRQDTMNTFALNLPKTESLFDGPTYSEIVDLFKDSPNVNVMSMSQESQEELLASTESNSLWKYALILALIFITLETAFHRYLK
jgi:hypothetical protein